MVHKCPKWPKMTKNYLCRTPYLKKHTSYDCDFCCTMTSPDAFSIFFKILTFCVVWWIKRQKMAQNDKKFCPSQSVSQEPNLIWLWFLVHKCKIMISLALFFIFSNSDFWGFWGVKGQKMTMTRNYQFKSITLYIHRLYQDFR